MSLTEEQKAGLIQHEAEQKELCRIVELKWQEKKKIKKKKK